MTHLLLEKGVRLALAVGLDAANVVGRGAVQNLQKLLQGGLQGDGAVRQTGAACGRQPGPGE